MVVIGHTNLVGIQVKTWIYSFHMPLFFVLSGFCYKERDIISFFKRKSVTLLLPYIWYYCLYIAVELILGIMNIQQIPDYLLQIALGMDDTLWFIMALFVTEFLYVVLQNLLKSSVFRYVCVMIVFSIGIVLANMEIHLFWRIDTAFVMLLFFVFGVWLRKKCFLSEYTKKGQLTSVGIVCVCMNIVFAFLNSNIDVRTGVYGNILYFVIAAISGTMIILIVSFLIRKVVFFEFLGRNSLCIYALNTKLPFWIRTLHESMSGLMVKAIGGILLMLAAVLSEWKNIRKNKRKERT